jgi:hypothetical protein
VLVPARLGRPTSAWLTTDYGVPIVTLVWRASRTLPDTGSAATGSATGIGAILTEIPASIDRTYLEKVVGSGGTVDEVDVGDDHGLWIGGALHELFVLDARGEPVPSLTRLAGRSLLWSHADLTLRLETSLGRSEAVAIARSVR